MTWYHYHVLGDKRQSVPVAESVHTLSGAIPATCQVVLIVVGAVEQFKKSNQGWNKSQRLYYMVSTQNC